MKKRISIFSVVLLVMLTWLGLPAGASPVVPGTTQLHIAATADANGRGVAVDGMGVVGVGVTISGTATISFQASTDQGVTWVSVTCTSLTASAASTSTATPGGYSCPVAGRTHFRTPLTGCVACTVTVNATTSPATPWNIAFDLNGNVLVSIPCLYGESICIPTSPDSYIMTKGSSVVNLAILTNVTTNTTGAVVKNISGFKSFWGQCVATSGTCAVTITLYGDNDTTAGPDLMTLCTLTLTDSQTMTGGTGDIDWCQPFNATPAYVYAKTTSISGTAATVNAGFGH